MVHVFTTAWVVEVGRYTHTHTQSREKERQRYCSHHSLSSLVTIAMNNHVVKRDRDRNRDNKTERERASMLVKLYILFNIYYPSFSQLIDY